MGWYEDKDRTSHLAVYKQEKKMLDEAKKAAEHGWVVERLVDSNGHVNIGRMVMTSFLWGSRSGQKVTVTYVRDDAWQRALEQAEQRKASEETLKSWKKVRDKSEKLEIELEQAAGVEDRALTAARVEPSLKAEKELLAAIKGVMKKRESVLEQTDEALRLTRHLKEVYELALQQNVVLTDFPDADAVNAELLASLTRRQSEQERDASLKTLQERVVAAAEGVQDLKKRADRAQARVEAASNEVLKAQNLSGSTDERLKAEKKLRDANADHEKWSRELAELRGQEETAITRLTTSTTDRNAHLDQEIRTVQTLSAPAQTSTVDKDGGPSRSEEVLALIEKLDELRREGILTGDEFAEKKEQLLARL